MTDAYIQFAGMYHLTGQTVSVTVGGLDCGDFVVDATGNVYVLIGTPALLTAAYVTSLAGATGENAMPIYFDGGSGSAWITIPAVVGLAYTSQGQLLRPSTADDLKSPSGGGLGKKRRLHRFAALLKDCMSGAISFGTSFSALRPASLRDASDAPGSELNGVTLYSGVYRDEIDDDYSFDGMLCWQVTRPVPASIVQIAGHLEAAED